MPRFLFTCAYDGLPFRGWQSQAGGGTVQDVLEEAFAAILKAPLRINGAGRTDAGVHAEAQCFHADLPDTCRMSPDNWLAALNTHLPRTLRIVAAREVAADFHARFNACGKEYRYLICTAPVLSPFLYGRAWHCPFPMDGGLLQRAMSLYLGKHDFRRLSARRGNEPDPAPEGFYERTISCASLSHREEGLLQLDFHGDGFMYRMVRMLVGSAVQVARGRLPVADLEKMLTHPGPTTRFCAPADGLYLMKVRYGGEASGGTAVD